MGDLLEGVVGMDEVKGDVDESEKYTSPELKKLIKCTHTNKSRGQIF